MDWAIRPACRGDAQAWTSLRQALWPEEDPAQLGQDVPVMLSQPGNTASFLAVAGKPPTAIGFAEATLRRDHVNGTDGSPVGFLEGWYVSPDWRGRGIGRALVSAVEEWVLGCGCRELASDALLDNASAHAAHTACGFEETERVVYYRKRLGK